MPLIPNDFLRSAKRTLNGFAAVLFIQKVTGYILIFAGAAAVTVFCPDQTIADSFLTSIYTDTALRVLWMIPVMIYARLNLTQSEPLPTRKLSVPLPLVFAAMCLVAFFARIPGAFLFGTDSNIEIGLSLSGTQLWVFAVSTAIIAPLTEEYMFRSVLLRAMRPFGRNGYLLVSSLLFASLHAPGSTFFAFCVALFLGYVAYETGGMRYTAGMHMLFNFVSVVLMIAQLSGNAAAETALALGYLAFIFIAGGVGIALCVRGLHKNGRLTVKWLPVRCSFTIPVLLFLAYRAVSYALSVLVSA